MVDDIFLKFNLEDDKYYRLSILHEILVAIGLIRMDRHSFTTDWFTRKLVSKKIILPEKSTHAKWYLSGKQIKDIVRAFLPGGTGVYNYED